MDRMHRGDDAFGKGVGARIAQIGDFPLPRIDEDDDRQRMRLTQREAIRLIGTLRQADHAQR